MTPICKCSCHASPLYKHEGECCEKTGQIYLDSKGNIVKRLYEKIFKKSEKVCPCCGGTGLAYEQN